MLEYQYIGIDQLGKKIKGNLLAFNLNDAESKLNAKNIIAIKLNQKKPGLVVVSFDKVKPVDLIHFTFQLEQLLKAGVPLMDALQDLTLVIDNKLLQKYLQNICSQMEDGASFSEALSLYPKVFNEVYISLIRVGEQTGRLENILAQLLSMLEWEAKLVAKLKKLMIYPLILLVLVTSVISLMMLFVVPELISFIEEMGGELGLATKSLIATSQFFQDYWSYLIAGSFSCYFLIKLTAKYSYAIRIYLAKLQLRIWLLGEISYQLKIARFARALGIMYQSGVSIIDAIKIASRLLNNEYLETQVDLVSMQINEGFSVHHAFQQSEVLSSLGLRMVAIGEQTGRLDDVLFNLSDYYDLQTNQKIDKLEPAIEPVLTLVMGLVVGWIMLAVLGPVYSLISELNI